MKKKHWDELTIKQKKRRLLESTEEFLKVGSLSELRKFLLNNAPVPGEGVIIFDTGQSKSINKIFELLK